MDDTFAGLDWRWQHTVNHRTEQAMLRRQDWMKFVARLEFGWYASWAAVMADVTSQVYYDPMKPWEWLLDRPLPELPPVELPPIEPLPIEPPMAVLGRQMFEPSGTLTAAAPGGFSSVIGTLVQYPEGASLTGGLPASADPMGWGNVYNYKGFGYLNQTWNQPKLVIGCWFLFQQVLIHPNGMAIMALGGPVDPLLEINLGNRMITIDVAYGAVPAQVLPFFPRPTEWLYLSLAAKHVGGTNWSVRAFYKLIGEKNLTQWASWDNQPGHQASYDNAMWGTSWGAGTQYEGRISACTIHAFEEDDFSDVVYPAEILEPV